MCKTIAQDRAGTLSPFHHTTPSTPLFPTTCTIPPSDTTQWPWHRAPLLLHFAREEGKLSAAREPAFSSLCSQLPSLSQWAHKTRSSQCQKRGTGKENSTNKTKEVLAATALVFLCISLGNRILPSTTALSLLLKSSSKFPLPAFSLCTHFKSKWTKEVFSSITSAT